MNFLPALKKGRFFFAFVRNFFILDNIIQRLPLFIRMLTVTKNKFGNYSYFTYLCIKKKRNDMKMIYILTCVNENCDIVSAKPYKSEDEARAAMKAEYEAEARDAEESGFELDDYFSGVERDTAGILYGETQYKWKVTEINDPVAEDAVADAHKSQFIETAYFEVKSNIDNDNIQILSEPVGDYASFYLDTANETIYVWNEKKRNYTSIFSLPVDTAFEIAKQLHNCDYREELR